MSTTLDREHLAAEGTTAATTASAFYRAVWRWHFYAGLFVVPFLLMLAITGIIYLFKPQLNALMYPQHVLPGGAMLLPSELLAATQAAYPASTITRYIPPPAADRSAEVVLSTSDGRDLTVFMNPYDARVLGVRDEYWNLQNIAVTLHGELMVGTVGDYLVELAACWGLVLMITGLYLWWPRGRFTLMGTLVPRLWTKNRRLFWRDLHSVPGFWGALIVVFMILTGLPWAAFWGSTFVRVWDQYPAQLWNEVPSSNRLAGELNTTGTKVVPWAVEPMPMPQSAPTGDHAAHTSGQADGGPTSGSVAMLDAVVALAESKGLAPGYGIILPDGPEAVYTVSVFPNDPRRQHTLHIDQYSGEVLAEIRFADYARLPQAVELGIALHEGKFFGLANQLLMLLACLVVITLALTGTVMWWQRRPAGRLGAPAMPKLPLWKGAVAVLVLLGLLFPLVGISLVAVLLLDFLLLRRVPALKQALS
jgi:uncharacterized iron-regulated membrane protein